MGFLEEMGSLALGSRLRRLSERLVREGAEAYQVAGVEFDPRGFPIFGKLAFHGPASVGELAADLGLSHPTVIQAVKTLEAQGWVESNPGRDARRRELRLTATGESLATRLRPVWTRICGEVEALQREESAQLLAAVDGVERALDRRSLADRVGAQEAGGLEIGPARPEELEPFRELSLEWVSRDYEVVDEDRRVLDDLEGSVIRPGGSVLVARVNHGLAGGALLIPHGEGVLEIAKMGVSPAYQGTGIGAKLLAAALARAEDMGAEWVTLDSNRTGAATAIRLYYRFGFVEIPPVPSPFGRADIHMAKRVAGPRPYRIRRMVPEDAGPVSVMLRRSFVEGWEAFIGADVASRYADRNLRSEALAKLATDPNSRVWVAMDRHGAIGGISQLEVSPGEAHLQRLYLAGESRGTGLAPLMLRVAEAQARWEGFAMLRLTCDPGNPRAWRFYTREGFASVGQRDYDLGEPDLRPRVHVMEKPLGSNRALVS